MFGSSTFLFSLRVAISCRQCSAFRRTIGHESRHEPLSLGDPLHFDRHRFDGLLDSLEARRGALGREPLSLGDPLDFDGDRIYGLVHALEPRAYLVRYGFGRAATNAA